MKKQKTTIGIIGLTRFGVLTASILSKHFEVFVCHYRKDSDVIKKLKKTGAKWADFAKVSACDVVIIAAPIANTEEYIKKLAQYAKKGSLILDVCSVKVFPCQWLAKHIKDKDIEIMGTHPMFGPNSTNFDLEKQTWTLDGLQIVLCPIRIKKEKLNAIKKFLESLKLEVIETTPEDHDRQTATTLALVHFLGRSLWEAGVRDDHMIFTPGFKKVTSIFKHTTGDSWGLFYDMHNFNPYAEKIRKKLMESFCETDLKVLENSGGEKLLALRKEIDRIDQMLFWLLGKRFAVVKKVGEVKKTNGTAIVDAKREKEIIEKKVKESDLDKEFVAKLYRLIFDQAYKMQK